MLTRARLRNRKVVCIRCQLKRLESGKPDAFSTAEMGHQGSPEETDTVGPGDGAALPHAPDPSSPWPDRHSERRTPCAGGRSSAPRHPHSRRRWRCPCRVSSVPGSGAASVRRVPRSAPILATSRAPLRLADRPDQPGPEPAFRANGPVRLPPSKRSAMNAPAARSISSTKRSAWGRDRPDPSQP